MNNNTSVIFYFNNQIKIFLETSTPTGTLEYVINAMKWALEHKKDGIIKVKESGRIINQIVIDSYEDTRTEEKEVVGGHRDD